MTVICVSLRLIKWLCPLIIALAGNLQIESEVFKLNSMGKNTTSSRNGSCLHGWRIPFLLWTSLRGQSWLTSFWREIYWLWANQEHSSEIAFAFLAKSESESSGKNSDKIAQTRFRVFNFCTKAQMHFGSVAVSYLPWTPECSIIYNLV